MSNNAIEKVIKVAKNEVGYLEKKSNSQLYDKTANAGQNNYTKYAYELDKIGNVYNGKKNGYSWCDIFVDWCFITAFGLDKAMEMLYQDYKGLGAGCPYSARYYKNKSAFYYNPQKGDQIFFKNGLGKFYHTGLVINYDKDSVYTIEGNTSSASGVVDNGGAVAIKKYPIHYNKIGGYGRPNWSLIPEEKPSTNVNQNKDGDEELTLEAFEILMKQYEAKLRQEKASEYAKQSCQKAIASGMFTDGDGDGLLDNPQAYLKRQEIAVLFDRLGLLDE